MSLNLAIFNYLMYMYIYLRYNTKEMFCKKYEKLQMLIYFWP